jgi:hypothetical protein
VAAAFSRAGGGVQLWARDRGSFRESDVARLIRGEAKAGHKDARVEYHSRADNLVLVLGAPPGSPAGLS